MCPGNGHDVKPARYVVGVSVAKIVLSRADEALLFTTIDRIGAVSEVISASESHFDEHQFGAVHHHQVELAGTDAVVPLDRAQTTPHEIRFGGPFGAAAPFGRRRTRAPR